MVEAARGRRRRARQGLAWSALGLASALLAAACTPSALPDKVAATVASVVQSVAVGMRLDGAIESVEATNRFTLTDSSKVTQTKASYAPQKVADDLPVRVLVAYRTAETSGADLSDLAGFTGRVVIEVTVENLTAKPQNIAYDAGGVSGQQTALVGVPLTVVASARLQGLTAGQVVVWSPASTDEATNGVVGAADDGRTTVQWAVVLAPPAASPAATLRLVLDAVDLKTPTFDLVVQAGLAAGPTAAASAGSDGADESTELDLLARTVELITGFNDVLGRAGQIITDVRQDLDAASDTLGKKTLADLTSSATNIAESMKALDEKTRALGQELQGSLSAIESSLIGLLRETVAAVSQLLGDTSAQPPTPETKGEGCQTQVAAPQEQASVYNTLMQVVGQLRAYSTANVACLDEVKANLRALVGPEQPDADSCQGAGSLSCALLAVRDSLSQAVSTLVTAGQQALAAIQPDIMADTATDFTAVSQAVDAVSQQMAAAMRLQASAARETQPDLVPLAGALAALGAGLADLQDAVDVLAADRASLAAALAAIHAQAVAAKDVLTRPPDLPSADPDTTIGGQNAALAARLCDLGASGRLPWADVEELRAYLTSSACAADSTASPLRPPVNYPLPMGQRLAGQALAWDAVIEASTASAATTPDVTALTAGLAASRGLLREAREAMQERETADGALWTGLARLSASVAALTDGRDVLATQLAELQQQQEQLSMVVSVAFSAAAQGAAQSVSQEYAEQLRQINEATAGWTASLEQMFAESWAGLTDMATAIGADGAKVVTGQQAVIAQTQTQASQDVASQIDANLQAIDNSVSDSSRSLDAAAQLLAGDLDNVLLDLGRQGGRTGLLGVMSTSADTVGSAAYQLALASEAALDYANVRGSDIAGLHFRQAAVEAMLRAETDLPPFQLKLPADATWRTYYLIHVGGD